MVLLLTFMLVSYNKKKCTIENKIEIVNPNYVFLGDSITYFYDLEKYYEGYPVVNSGVDGDKINDIFQDLEARVYRYNPSKIFIMIGINNLLYEDHDDEISTNIEKLAKEIKKELPNCEIYIESILPMNTGWHTYVDSDTIKNINKELKQISKKNGFIYIDIYSKVIDEENNFDIKYTDDGLHPNNEGYKKITKVISEYL